MDILCVCFHVLGITFTYSVRKHIDKLQNQQTLYCVLSESFQLNEEMYLFLSLVPDINLRIKCYA